MNVYFALSEYLEDGGNPYGDPPEPPEGGHICRFVVAESRDQAKYLVFKAEKLGGDMADMPRFAVRKVGEAVAEMPHVMEDAEAGPWWQFDPGIEAPRGR